MLIIITPSQSQFGYELSVHYIAHTFLNLEMLLISLICVHILVKYPKFLMQPSSSSVNVTQSAVFECSATGYNVEYQWRIGSGSFPSKVTGINTNTLVIPYVRSSDDNIYTCTISNDGGSVTSNPVKLTVTGMYDYYLLQVNYVMMNTLVYRSTKGDC